MHWTASGGGGGCDLQAVRDVYFVTAVDSYISFFLQSTPKPCFLFTAGD